MTMSRAALHRNDSASRLSLYCGNETARDPNCARSDKHPRQTSTSANSANQSESDYSSRRCRRSESRPGLLELFRRGGKSSSEINAKDAPGSRLKLVELTATGQSHHVLISPDGKYVAYTRRSQNSVEIWVRQLASNTNVELLTADRIAGLGFDKSGESLLFVKGDPSALYRVSLIGGVPTKLIDGLEGKFALSPDGSQLAFIREVVNRDGQREFSLYVANSDGRNERTLLVRAHPGKLDVPIWSSDGQSIICAHGNSAAGSQDVSLIAVNVNTGEKKDLSSFKFFLIKKMDWLPDRSGLIISARKSAGYDNQLFRVSYPAMEVTQITEGLTSYSRSAWQLTQTLLPPHSRFLDRISG